MNSINQNNELSNFFNYLKKEPFNLVSFNDYPFDYQNSQSLNFVSANPYEPLSNPLDKSQFHIKGEQNSEFRDQTIGFNLQGILENSISYTFEELKNSKLKKSPTFMYSQGFLNSGHENDDFYKEEPRINQQNKKQIKKKQNNKQIIKISGKYQEKSDLLKLENLYVNSQNNQTNINKKVSSKDQTIQTSIQNLKSIAKIAFKALRKEKATSYQAIAAILFKKLSKQSIGYESQHEYKKDQASAQDEIKNSEKSKLIEKMINNKSCLQIKQMKSVEEDFFDTKENKQIEEDSESQEIQGKDSVKNIKNIRRRLYDAINVMLAANIIEKRDHGLFELKSNENCKRLISMSKNEQLESYEELQMGIQQKKERIEIKKKYKQMLRTKYLALQKHVLKNKLANQKAIKNQSKLYFPLVIAGVQLPTKLIIEQDNQVVKLESKGHIDINCDLDLLGLLYWIEKDEMMKKEEELQITRVEREKQKSDQFQRIKKRVKFQQ